MSHKLIDLNSPHVAAVNCDNQKVIGYVGEGGGMERN